MFSYSVFGGILRSPFEFPELTLAEGPPTWTLHQNAGPPSTEPGSQVGDDSVYADVRVRCFRGQSAHSLIYDDTGRFDVEGGSRVTWFPPHAGADLLDAVRADVVGRVIALALHQAHVVSLHASAVAVEGRGIALLAPKMHGKSTLATALVRQGAKLLSDDTVPVVGGDTPHLLPGVHQLRLWKDSAKQLAAERAADATSSRKIVLDRLDAGDLQRTSVPFAAAYVLLPVEASDSEAASRTPLPEIQGTLAFIEHSKLGPLLGGDDAAAIFQQAAAIARRVPTYALYIARDLDRVGVAAATIHAWHAA